MGGKLILHVADFICLTLNHHAQKNAVGAIISRRNFSSFEKKHYTAMQFLNLFLFSARDQQKLIAKLSGGDQLDALFASGETINDVATHARRYEEVKNLIDEKELRWLELSEKDA